VSDIRPFRRRRQPPDAHPPPPPSHDIAPINIEEEMRRSYLDYAMSVICRAHCPMRATA